MAKAVARVYSSRKTNNRGELGELLLHIALRTHYSTQPGISKIYYKDSANDTVKGFDAVHVVSPDHTSNGKLELWLGESKFYNNLSGAIGDVLKELEEHLDKDYLKQEFAIVSDKIDDQWEHASSLKKLLQAETSLDEVFERTVIPVLLTYDSATAASHTTSSEAYRNAIETELRAGWNSFCTRLSSREMPREVQVRLILIPLATKRDLVAAFDRRLKATQEGLG